MSEFPLDPIMAKVILSSIKYKCVNEAVTIIAMLNVPVAFLRPKNNASEADAAKSRFSHEDGDHLTLLNAFNAFILKGENADWCYDHYINYRAMKQAKDIRDQLLNIIAKQKKSLQSNPNNHPDYSSNIRKAILSGYFMQVANLQKGNHYLTFKDD